MLPWKANINSLAETERTKVLGTVVCIGGAVLFNPLQRKANYIPPPKCSSHESQYNKHMPNWWFQERRQRGGPLVQYFFIAGCIALVFVVPYASENWQRDFHVNILALLSYPSSVPLNHPFWVWIWLLKRNLPGWVLKRQIVEI